ncbi:MAG: hypothetical protein ACOZE7_02520 [Pseudomonadota bacterium]|jgi:hypothetical protein|uniref:hypothetical protein n=1 Tax=Aquabacterium sp. TaxID=1872578 RepID=UPI003BAE487F
MNMIRTALPPRAAILLSALMLATTVTQAQVSREQRDQFAARTVDRCIQSQRADPTQAAQTDAAIREFCACYARRVADAMPDDVLNTSLSAATPQQLEAAQSVMRQSAQACRGQTQP